MPAPRTRRLVRKYDLSNTCASELHLAWCDTAKSSCASLSSNNCSMDTDKSRKSNTRSNDSVASLMRCALIVSCADALTGITSGVLAYSSNRASSEAGQLTLNCTSSLPSAKGCHFESVTHSIRYILITPRFTICFTPNNSFLLNSSADWITNTLPRAKFANPAENRRGSTRCYAFKTYPLSTSSWTRG